MEIDWSLCIICQRKTSEVLKCPLENPVQKAGSKSEAYMAFLKNVEEFRNIDALPLIVKFGCEETAENFTFHRASWHKSCLAKFNNGKLTRAKKAHPLCKNLTTDVTWQTEAIQALTQWIDRSMDR